MSTLSRIKNAISTAVATPLHSAADIRAAIGGGEQRAGEIAQTIASLTAHRASLLVDGDDAAIDRAETELSKVTRDGERTAARLTELRRRLIDAEARERQADLDAKHERALRHQQAERALLEKYNIEAKKLAELLIDLRAHSAERTALNAALKAEGDPRNVAPGKSLVTTRQDMHYGPIADHAVLPNATDHYARHWPLQSLSSHSTIAAARARIASE